MKKALISSIESVSYISSWAKSGNIFTPIVTIIPNAMRIAEVTEEEFPVYKTLFWVDCANDVVADKWYWDSFSKSVIVKPEDAPYPVQEQPNTQGTQTV